MGIVLAIIAAVTYGIGDFFGGLSTKRNSVWLVVPISGAFGLLTALAAALALDPAPPPRSDVELGVAVGIIGGGAIACLYRGLAIARMSVVAPITAVVAAVVPVAFGLITGERPHAAAYVGILLALISVALISSASIEDVSGDPEPKQSGYPEAFAAGLGFGLLYVLLAKTSHGMWPLVAARATSVVLVGAIALAARQLTLPRKGLGAMAATGMFDMGGNVFYLLALRHTLVAIAAVITSLYPASTVLLARVVLRERLTRLQWVGVACAAAGVALIAYGR